MGGTYVPLATVSLGIIVFLRTGLRDGMPVGGAVIVLLDLKKAGFETGSSSDLEEEPVAKLLQQLWNDERGQDIAEYAVMLAVILVIVVGTIRLIGSNANTVFSQVGSAIQ